MRDRFAVVRARRCVVVDRTPRERLLTKSEMCEALGVGEAKLRQLVKAGRLRVLRLGHRTTRFPESEIARLAATARPA